MFGNNGGGVKHLLKEGLLYLGGTVAFESIQAGALMLAYSHDAT